MTTIQLLCANLLATPIIVTEDHPEIQQHAPRAREQRITLRRREEDADFAAQVSPGWGGGGGGGRGLGAGGGQRQFAALRRG